MLVSVKFFGSSQVSSDKLRFISQNLVSQNFAQTAATPELPRLFLDTTYAPQQGRTISVSAAIPDSCLPLPGIRVTPEDAGALPKIVSPNAVSAIGTADNAHHYRLIGLEITIAADVDYNYGIVRLGEGGSSQNQIDFIPHDLTIDRCYIHGDKRANVVRGIALNSASTSVIDSYISDIHGIGFDTQAICGWNGKALINWLIIIWKLPAKTLCSVELTRSS
ncbi:MAG: hypothetical protein HYZ51_00045 [Candidatus Doudnabacteria bacterium]|nr:hypothetical protein [Candidatus Doudnabacteria bacterium]